MKYKWTTSNWIHYEPKNLIRDESFCPRPLSLFLKKWHRTNKWRRVQSNTNKVKMIKPTIKFRITVCVQLFHCCWGRKWGGLCKEMKLGTIKYKMKYKRLSTLWITKWNMEDIMSPGLSLFIKKGKNGGSRNKWKGIQSSTNEVKTMSRHNAKRENFSDIFSVLPLLFLKKGG